MRGTDGPSSLSLSLATHSYVYLTSIPFDLHIDVPERGLGVIVVEGEVCAVYQQQALGVEKEVWHN